MCGSRELGNKISCLKSGFLSKKFRDCSIKAGYTKLVDFLMPLSRSYGYASPLLKLVLSLGENLIG